MAQEVLPLLSPFARSVVWEGNSFKEVNLWNNCYLNQRIRR